MEKEIRQWMHGTCIYLRYEMPGKFVHRASVAGLMRTGTDIFLYGKGNTVYPILLKGHEMFVNRKEKSITQATILLSARRVLEKQAEGVVVSGPKKIGTFGASYLYPVFCQIGLITEKMNESEEI